MSLQSVEVRFIQVSRVFSVVVESDHRVTAVVLAYHELIDIVPLLKEEMTYSIYSKLLTTYE